MNMEPKNGGLEDDFPFHLGDFQVLCQFSGAPRPLRKNAKRLTARVSGFDDKGLRIDVGKLCTISSGSQFMGT